MTNRHGSRSDVAFGIGLFAVAFALRFRVALALAAEPVWDGHYYDFGARRIAAGLGYSDDITLGGARVWHPWCHYPVGYSAYLAAFYKFLGTEPWVAHAANGLVGGLLAVVTFLLAREALGPVRARLAGGLVALHPGLVLYGALLMSEPLAALLVLSGFWVAIRVDRASGSRFWLGPAAGALVLGVSALVRPQGLLCAPLLAIVPGCAGARRRVAGAALASALALVPVLPWTARNCRVMDGCALVSTNGGWNLAIGAFPRATGRFETLRSSDGCREVTGQVQQDRCWLAYGIASIAERPLRWIGLMPAKLAYTFDHESFAVEYLREARPSAWPEERRVALRTVTTAAHRLLLAASALAFVAVARPRRNVDRSGAWVQVALLGLLGLGAYAAFAADTPTFWPIAIVACALPWVPLPGRPAAHPGLLLPASLVATVAITHAVFFGEDRYHVVATPALCLLAAAALRVPARAAGGKRSQNARGAST